MNIKIVNKDFFIIINNIDLNRFVQNKASIDSSTSFNYLNKTKNTTNNLNMNTYKENKDINNPRTKLNFSEICNYKMEINKLVEENIYLKTELIEIKSKISQFENMLERTDLKYQEQMNNYQKQLIKYNNYIHEVYIFFNNITNNFFPKLNFSLQKNESILINFDSFQSKLKSIENYIFDLNKKIKCYNNNINNNISYIFNTESEPLLTDISFDKSNLEKRINFLEKKLNNKPFYKIPNKLNKNYINYSVRNKYDYCGLKNDISFGNNICPKYHKSKQFNKIKNNERMKTSFSRMDDSTKKSFRKISNNNLYKNSNLTTGKKYSNVKPKRSLTPISKQKNFFYNI